MTPTALEAVPMPNPLTPAGPSSTIPGPPRSFITAWFDALVAIVAPGHAAGVWPRIALWLAWIVALVNIALWYPWLLLFYTLFQAWDANVFRVSLVGNWVKNPWDHFTRLFHQSQADIWRLLTYDTLASISSIASIAGLLVLGLAMGFFVLLPFAARPGANRACVRHVLRAVLLGTAFIHFWMLAFTVTVASLIFLRVPAGVEHWMPPIFTVFAAMLLWTLIALARIVRRDYRTPADLPAPKTLQCDECGYDLHMSDPNGRCPECGKPVAESIEQRYRQPTAWESNPRVRRLGVVLAQIRDVIFRPRDLFFHMPTGTGQGAAHRWLVFSMSVVGCIVFWTVPVLGLINVREDWTLSTLVTLAAGGLALAVVWVVLGLMMVGIETAGVAAVAHFRGQNVPLASSAKVTCYSSVLMWLWAFLGGLQIIYMNLAWQYTWYPHSSRTEQIVTVITLAIAHIGGLLWFEWTVYRGLRAIQFANH